MGWPPPDLIRAVGSTLVHFLWQGALIAALLALALRATAKARTRHDLALLALAAMAAAPVATFLMIRADAPLLVIVAPGEGDGETLASWHAPVVGLWAAGVLALAIRMAGGIWVVERLRRESIALSAAWTRRCEALHARLPTTLPVLFRQSREVAGPMVVGWVRPVVLLPSAAFLRMPADQLEAVILHELAHVRRFDAFANLFQSVVETLLFYHPAVWWVGRRVRIEREHCCDDLAVEVSGDRNAYVRALLGFETQRATVALAAGGSQVKQRVTRLLGLSNGPERAALPKLVALAMFIFAVFAASAGVDAEAAPDLPAPVAAAPASPPPVPAVQVSPGIQLVESPRVASPAVPAVIVPVAEPSAPAPAAAAETTPRPAAEPVELLLAEAVTPLQVAAPTPIQPAARKPMMVAADPAQLKRAQDIATAAAASSRDPLLSPSLSNSAMTGRSTLLQNTHRDMNSLRTQSVVMPTMRAPPPPPVTDFRPPLPPPTFSRTQ